MARLLRSFSLLFCLCLVLSVGAVSAWGVRQPAHLRGRPSLEVASGPPARAFRPVAVRPGPMARAWHRFEATVGGTWRAIWDGDTGVPLRVYGSGIAAPGSVASASVAERHAMMLLSRHVDLLAPGAEPEDFLLVANEVFQGVRSVGFLQTHEGVPVVTGQVSFRYKADRMVAIGSEALPWVDAPDPGGALDPVTAEDAAQQWLWDDLGWSTRVMGVDGPVILPIVSARATSLHAVWIVTLRSASPRARWDVYVDVHTGLPVARRQTLSFFSGQLLYDAPVRYPAGGRQDYPAQFADVTAGGADLTTDVDGMVTFSASTVSIQAYARGPYVVVENEAGANAAVSLTLDASGDTLWSDPDTEQVDAQIASFIHANEIKLYARTLNPGLTWLDSVVTVNVNGAGECNASSDGDTIYFLLGSNQCENTGRLADVLYHEFGHSLHYQSIVWGVGSFDGALSEGLADFLAATYTGDPGMGRGFFKFDGNYPLRHIDPEDKEYVWPQDIGTETHETGLIISGALWDLRKEMVATYGEADGVSLTNRLFYAVMRRAADIPSAYVEVLVEDDDDGDLSNGTPNACAISKHFGAHGLTGEESLFGGLIIRRPKASGLDVSISIESPDDGCDHAQVTSVSLDWDLRRDPTQSGSEEMTADGTDLFTASIPVEGEGMVVRYMVRVELSDGTVKTFPENRADPMYETYVGDVVEIYCTGFETDPFAEGWTHGLTSGQPSAGADDWHWGPSLAGASSGDPSEPYEGNSVIGNDLGGVVDGETYNGLYQPGKVNYALSPVIDASGFDQVRLQYRRWLTVEDAYYDQASIYANDELVWQNLSSDEGEGSSTHHEDHQWRFHDVDLTPHLDADGMVQVRFQLSSDGGLEFGGWTLDDLCVVGVMEPRCGDGEVNTPAEQCDDGPDNSDATPDACRTDCVSPVCGDGVVDSGEQCDDGNDSDEDDCLSDCTLRDSNGRKPGGCGCSSGSPGGRVPAAPLLLAVLALAVILRRRSPGWER